MEIVKFENGKENKKKKDSKKKIGLFMQINKKGILVRGVNKKKVKIPKGVTVIGEDAFRDCDKIEEIILPEGLKIIERDAFLGCKSLERVILPSSLEVISYIAFEGCGKLRELHILGNINYIASNAFMRCHNLNLEIETSLFNFDIWSHAGHSFDDLKSIVIYNQKLLIDELDRNDDKIDYAIEHKIDEIRKIEILDRIKNKLFKENINCDTSYMYENHEDFIESVLSDFHDNLCPYFMCSCDYKTDFENHISKYISKIKIEYEHYINNQKNTSNQLISKKEKNKNEIGLFMKFDEDGTLIKGVNKKEIKIPKSVTAIGKEAFRDCDKIEEIIFPEGLKIIGDGAFENCTSLKLIEINDGVTIGEGAFKNCKSLESATLPNDLQCIQAYTFQNCSSLKEIIIPTNVTNIGLCAFQECDSLNTVVLSESLIRIGEYAFAKCSGILKLEIPNKLEYIESHAFEHCENLREVILPKCLKHIGCAAFSYCDALQEIDIPNGIRKIEDDTFRDCKYLKKVFLPESITEIGDSAFSYCSLLNKIMIPNNVSRIGLCSFSNCKLLGKIELSSNIIKIGSSSFSECCSLNLVIETSLFSYHNYYETLFWKAKKVTVYGEDLKRVYLDDIREKELLDKIKSKLLENNIKDDFYFSYNEHKEYIEKTISMFNNEFVEDYDYRDDFNQYMTDYISNIKNNSCNISNQTNISNKLISEEETIEETVTEISPKKDTKNKQDNKFIQIIYNEKLCSIPLDFNILRCIEQQDDIEILFKNNYVVREYANDEVTFRINNVLRNAYLNCVSRLNICEELREYLERYDKYIKYEDSTSIISIKTMVNELSFIYYLEYTSKLNGMNLTEEPLNSVRLDKGLDKRLVKSLNKI